MKELELKITKRELVDILGYLIDYRETKLKDIPVHLTIVIQKLQNKIVEYEGLEIYKTKI